MNGQTKQKIIQMSPINQGNLIKIALKKLEVEGKELRRRGQDPTSGLIKDENGIFRETFRETVEEALNRLFRYGV